MEFLYHQNLKGYLSVFFVLGLRSDTFDLDGAISFINQLDEKRTVDIPIQLVEEIRKLFRISNKKLKENVNNYNFWVIKLLDFYNNLFPSLVENCPQLRINNQRYRYKEINLT